MLLTVVDVLFCLITSFDAVNFSCVPFINIPFRMLLESSNPCAGTICLYTQTTTGAVSKSRGANFAFGALFWMWSWCGAVVPTFRTIHSYRVPKIWPLRVLN